MIELTLADGPKDFLDPSKAVRMVRALEAHGHKNAKTTIHRPEVMLVTEPLDFVAGKVREAVGKKWTKLTLKDGKDVWFNVNLADGPIRLVGFEPEGGIRSAIILNGKKQLVRETPQEVAVVFKEAEKEPRPIPPDPPGNIFSKSLDFVLKPFTSAQPPLWED